MHVSSYPGPYLGPNLAIGGHHGEGDGSSNPSTSTLRPFDYSNTISTFASQGHASLNFHSISARVHTRTHMFPVTWVHTSVSISLSEASTAKEMGPSHTLTKLARCANRFTVPWVLIVMAPSLDFPRENSDWCQNGT